MTSFGSWYDQQRAAENGEDAAATSSSIFSSFGMDSEQILPLFNSESLQGFSFENMKASMEAQMPKKILGMGYQQRFKVSLWKEGKKNIDVTVSREKYQHSHNYMFLLSANCLLYRSFVHCSFFRQSFLL
jgi:hypothetical protein